MVRCLDKATRAGDLGCQVERAQGAPCAWPLWRKRAGQRRLEERGIFTCIFWHKDTQGQRPDVRERIPPPCAGRFVVSWFLCWACPSQVSSNWMKLGWMRSQNHLFIFFWIIVHRNVDMPHHFVISFWCPTNDYQWMFLMIGTLLMDHHLGWWTTGSSYPNPRARCTGQHVPAYTDEVPATLLETWRFSRSALRGRYGGTTLLGYVWIWMDSGWHSFNCLTVQNIPRLITNLTTISWALKTFKNIYKMEGTISGTDVYSTLEAWCCYASLRAATGGLEVAFMRLMHKLRKTLFTLTEQPSGSWAYKTPEMVRLCSIMGLRLACKSVYISIYFILSISIYAFPVSFI